MINVNRLRYMIDELLHDEEYIQWVGKIMVRVSNRDALIYLAIHNDDDNRFVRKAFTKEQIDSSKINVVSFEVDKMLKGLGI